MNDSNGVVFRVEKNKNYTVMCNHHLQNTELSLKAKGLLSLMLSLPDTWDYSINGLVAICKDGLDSVKTGVKELEQQGYIKREQERLGNGTMGRVNFLVSELPTLKNNADKGLSPQGEKPPTVKPSTEKPPTEKPIQSNTKELSTNKSITNQSIFQGEENYPINNFDEIIEQTERKIEKQIEYDILLERYEPDQLSEFFELMLEVYLHDGEYMYIGKEKKLASLVKRRIAMITFADITSVIDGLNENTTQIKDMKAYLLTCLYNAPTTKYNKVSSQVNHDLAEIREQERERNNSSYDLEEFEKMMLRSPLLDD